MFAGSGIMGLEALSRGFSSVVAIEKNKKVYAVIKSNIDKFREKLNIKLLNGDSLKLVASLNSPFDVIYIDPPYFSGVYESSLNSIKNISKNAIVILEHVTEVDFGDYKLVKQKKYGDKFISFLELE